MRAFFIIIFFLLNWVSIFAKYEHSYKGWIKVQGQKIDFELAFNIAKNNIISGTSITAKGTNDQTTCRVKGKYTRNTGAIYFYETVVLSSKAKKENLNFCLLTARLNKKTTKGRTNYSGSLTGFIRGTKNKCAAGSIFVTQENKIPVSPEPLLKIVPLTVDTLYSHIHSKKIVQYKVVSAELSLEIWDDIQVDGDRVSIFLDGKLVLENYELSKEKKRLSLKMTNKSESHYIKIIALNEGVASPNTSRIQLGLDNEKKELIAHINTGESIYIKLRK